MTRSINELIGWERIDGWRNGERWTAPGRAAYYPGDGYTADDLLAWLREQGVNVWTEYSDGAPCSLTATVVELQFAAGDAQRAARAPTLLAALEYAVRAVAGES